MIEIEFEPELSNCIQTLAKREHGQILRELLREERMDEHLQEKLELLTLFLESVDFGKLRSEYERYLLDGKRVKFKVKSSDGQLEYEYGIC